MSFLEEVNGIIHVGASVGEELGLYYNKYKLPVVWIEAIPDIYNRLKINTSLIRNQICINSLVTDIDDKEYDFYITDNECKSSSIFKIKLHKEMYPNINYISKIKLKSKTLKTIINNYNLDLNAYNCMVLDTQGSELLALNGLGKLIDNFKYIQIEVANFEAYENCCQLKDVEEFMNRNNFKVFDKKNISGFMDQWKNSYKENYCYYEILYKNINL